MQVNVRMRVKALLDLQQRLYFERPAAADHQTGGAGN
jgi:hypothetical protein